MSNQEDKKWGKKLNEMYSSLEDIKKVYQTVRNTRDAFIKGKTTREEVFTSLNLATTNLLLFQGLQEQSIKIIATWSGIAERCERIEKKLERKEKIPNTGESRNLVNRKPKGEANRNASIIPFPCKAFE